LVAILNGSGSVSGSGESVCDIDLQVGALRTSFPLTDVPLPLPVQRDQKFKQALD
jgi:hypothetical protein